MLEKIWLDLWEGGYEGHKWVKLAQVLCSPVGFGVSGIEPLNSATIQAAHRK